MMGQVTVTIAGRVYRMACGEGEESHVEGLACQVEQKIDELRKAFGEIGDQRITVMAALTFADDLSEAKRKLAEREIDLVNLQHNYAELINARQALELRTQEQFHDAAMRIETVVRELNDSKKND